MTNKQLETFLHLAETLNFRKTAEHLFLSQTAVSFQIRGLEEELNVKLFDRNKKEVSLTPAGITFRDYAKRMLALTNEAYRSTSVVAAGYTGFVTVGFSIDTNKAGVSDLIKDFSEQNPRIRMNLLGGYPEVLMQKLLYDQCDIFITPYFIGLETGDLSYYRVGRYKQVAAFNKEHRLSDKNSLHFEDFSGETFIAVTNENLQLAFTEEFITKLCEKEIPFVISASTDNIDTVFLMLEANLGVTVIPDYFSERLSGSLKIRFCEIAEELNGTDLVAVWKTKNESESLQTFIDYLKKYFPEDNT